MSLKNIPKNIANKSLKYYPLQRQGHENFQYYEETEKPRVLRTCKSDAGNYSSKLCHNKFDQKSKFQLYIRKLYNMIKPLFGICLALFQCMSVAFVSLIVSFIEKAGMKNVTIPSANYRNVTQPYQNVILDVSDPIHLQIKTGVSPFFISNMRFIYQCLIALPLAVYNKDSLIPPKRYAIPLLFRCIAGSLGVVSLNFAMSYAPISDASSIVYTSPIYVAILARLFLGERISWIDSALLSVTIIGILFITRPSIIFKYIFPHDKPMEISDQRYPNHHLGLGFAAISAFASSVAIVSMRKVRSLPFSLVLIDFAIVGIIITTILCLSFEAYTLPPCNWDRYLLLGSSLLGSFGQFFLYGALQFENAGIISAVSCMGVVFSLVFQIVFKDESPPWTSAFGASLVSISIFCLGLRKWLLGRREVRQAVQKRKLERISEMLETDQVPDKKFSEVSMRPAHSLDEIALRKKKYKVLPVSNVASTYDKQILQLVPEENELPAESYGPDILGPLSTSVPQSGAITPRHPPVAPFSALTDSSSKKVLTEEGGLLQHKLSAPTKKVSRSSQKGIGGLIDSLSRRSSFDRSSLHAKDSLRASSRNNLFQFAPLKYPGATVTLPDGEKVFVNPPKDENLTTKFDNIVHTARTDKYDEDEVQSDFMSDSEGSIEYGAVTPAPD